MRTGVAVGCEEETEVCSSACVAVGAGSAAGALAVCVGAGASPSSDTAGMGSITASMHTVNRTLIHRFIFSISRSSSRAPSSRALSFRALPARLSIQHEYYFIWTENAMVFARVDVFLREWTLKAVDAGKNRW